MLCDFGLFLPVGIGPDFMHIPAGDDPLGRYSISYDFYMMTTELLSAQYQAIISGTAGTSYTPVGSSDWLSAAYLAHQLSALMGVEQCYDCPTNQQSCSVAVEPTECTGYRLPTEWEWEYAARSGTTKDVWTGAGPDLGGNLSSNVIGCNELVVLDGVGNPSLQDYAWFCMNNQSGSRKMAAQKLPNGFGLYDMHGNMDEWTEDIAGIGSPSGVDPWSGYLGLSSTNRYYRGGNYRSAGSLGASSRSTSSQYDDWRGFRLVIRVP